MGEQGNLEFEIENLKFQIRFPLLPTPSSGTDQNGLDGPSDIVTGEEQLEPVEVLLEGGE